MRVISYRTIRNEVEHRTALQISQEFMLRSEEDLTRGEVDYLDVLTDLIRNYELAHYRMPKNTASEKDRLRSLVEDAGMDASNMGRLLGTRALGSILLTGRRGLSKNHIRILAGHFKIDQGYFLR